MISLNPGKAKHIANRILADYDAHRFNEMFAEQGVDWLTPDDAYLIQRAVAQLQIARGEQRIGYKIGCLSTTIQEQLGLRQPVRGYLWGTEVVATGSHIIYDACASRPKSRFVKLAIEGEIALRLSRDISPDVLIEGSVADCIDCWFPVIELHNAVFRGPEPTSQELIAGNAMHAGFVAPSFSGKPLAHAEIRMEIDGELVETRKWQIPREDRWGR